MQLAAESDEGAGPWADQNGWELSDIAGDYDLDVLGGSGDGGDSSDNSAVSDGGEEEAGDAHEAGSKEELRA
ncbi:hypothetical protein GPECTOR_8g107 [Gonium pectorale]|uniref:Uncharacterized protein n=1 Tax=Gonium pectorale TaxID=33097 RepID=A0A150GSL9_GONPE|nr:hypothetical protein GPECTOR_8g107 [Gonium pectorale]|eukprot:KXZ52712.1 hypothetical protein GPECTOR_8g107 [Gonium pectorale]